jgi:hypothetical protein
VLCHLRTGEERRSGTPVQYPAAMVWHSMAAKQVQRPCTHLPVSAGCVCTCLAAVGECVWYTRA